MNVTQMQKISEIYDLINYLYQHVREPTRESNILDLVISSDINMVPEVEVLELLGNSDHNIIICSLILDVGLNKNSGQPGNIIRQITMR